MLYGLEGQAVSVNAIYDIHHEIPLLDEHKCIKDIIRARKTGDTGNFVNVLKIKIDAQVLLISGINNNDWLIKSWL